MWYKAGSPSPISPSGSVGGSVTEVRWLLEDRELIGIRRGERSVLSVPEAFLDDDGPVPALKGTFTVLADGGFSDAEIIAWLFAPDPTWPGRVDSDGRAPRRLQDRGAAPRDGGRDIAKPPNASGACVGVPGGR